MTLSNERIMVRGLTPHAHERDAIDFVIKTLPDRDPYRIWALVDLVDPSGRRYDLDLVVIGYHAVYLVEIKSHPATITGDVVDLYLKFDDGRRSTMENPMRLTAHKARVLGSMLDRRLTDARPFVQELVFFADPNVKLNVEGAAAAGLVTRHTFERAITHGEYPGASAIRQREINRPTAQAVTRALSQMGLHAGESKRKVGGLVLEDVLVETPTYQDHVARYANAKLRPARVRTYQVPLSATPERRSQVVRAAERDARALSALADHPNILTFRDYDPVGPTGAPAVVFDHFEGGVPLDAFLRAHPGLTLDAKLTLLGQLAAALSYCHRKEILHRGLAPSAVLVREHPDTKAPDVRLFNFQLATSSELSSSGEVHLSHYLGTGEDVFVAPEVLQNPQHASAMSDVFSFGAVVYLVLTGRQPGATIPERAALLARGYLSLATASDEFAPGARASNDDHADGVPSDLDAVMEFATAQSALNRSNNAEEWFHTYLVEALTAPDKKRDTSIDPLLAEKGDRLHDDVEVLEVLGTGSTARTLRVRTPEGVFALKVALDDHNDRVAREAAVLRDLQTGDLSSNRIVRLYAVRELHGRTCLQMTDAGLTLANELAKDGVPALDYAQRWGEDLLSALSHLEERGVQHRDIKPGNLGVLSSEQKRARHLMLFDFSLSAVEAREVRAGTPAYRDPFLAERGRWDDAADRYAAAITLHELLTGDRPRWGSHDMASASKEPITLHAERIDASLRAPMAAFFARALHRDVAARYSTAEAMRAAWLGCFSGTAPTAPSQDDAPAAGSAMPEGLALDTPVEALPLSARAKNALFRAGLLDVRALLGLPNNQLSAMRGVGRTTAQDLQSLLQRPELLPLRSQLAQAKDASAALPAVRAPSRPALQPVVQDDEAALVDALPSLEGYVQRFLPAPTKKRGESTRTYVRMLCGLDQPPGRQVDSVASLASALGVTRPLLYAALATQRSYWATRPERADLLARVHAVLAPSGGLAPLDVAAEALARELGAAPEADSQRIGEHDFTHARALLRVAVETSGVASTADSSGSVAALKLVRVGERRWLGPENLDAQGLRSLGALADRLAAADPLLSPGAAAEQLQAHVHAPEERAQFLAQHPPHRLIALAAWASDGAEKSARLELYPRGLDPERSLDLCLGALPASLTEAQVHAVVQARYPAAAALPTGAPLAALLDRRGYVWRAESQVFVRKQEGAQEGTLGPTSRAGRTQLEALRGPDPDAADFQADIAVRIKRGRFCVLEVVPVEAHHTAAELRERLDQASVISLDAALIAAMHRVAREQAVDEAVVYETDRAGKHAAHWPYLRDLMARAAEHVLSELRTHTEPLVLTDPGLLARYGLSELVRGLIARSDEDGAPAIFLVVPVAEDAGGARIVHPAGDLTLPLISPAQRLRVPQAWLKHLDRARAS